MNWINGQYTLAAVTVGVERNLADKAKSEYIKEPILSVSEKKRNAESNEEIAVFEMKKRIIALRQSGLPESPK